MSVRPSVCLSVRYVSVPYENRLTYRHSIFTMSVSRFVTPCPAHVFLSFFCIRMPVHLPIRHIHTHNLFHICLCFCIHIIYGSPIILFLSASNIFTKSRRGHPCGGAKYRWGIKISLFSTNKSLYLANDARYRHSYYGRRIGTRMRSIRWCHF